MIWVWWVGTWDRVFQCGASDFVLVSRILLAQRYRDNGHFLRVSSSSRHETMVGDTLSRVSALCVHSQVLFLGLVVSIHNKQQIRKITLIKITILLSLYSSFLIFLVRLGDYIVISCDFYSYIT